MRVLNPLSMLLAALLLLSTAAGLDARTKKGDKLLAEGREAEQRQQWDKALALYEQALAEDPADVGYQIPTRRVRFQAAQAHVELGLKLRARGKLDEALAEFSKAYATDPASVIAEQELRTTLEMIERNKKKDLKPEEEALTPAALERKQTAERMAAIQGPPELRPISPQPINLKMTNQPARVLFETVGKLAGINVVFDPDFRLDQNASRPVSVELANATLEQALDYLAAMTKSYWKPLSSNTIFVTNDNQAKRRDYEDYVVKVFYLSNITTGQELQEITTTFRSVTDIRRVFPYTAQNAIVVRGTADQVALAEKIIHDLDKPKSEVVVDVLVMEANRAKTRDLAATLTSGGAAGLSAPIVFTPRNPVLLGGDDNDDSDDTDDNTTNNSNVNLSQLSSLLGLGGLSTGLTSSQSPSAQLISLARISRISTNDFSITLPGALLEAVMGDRNTKVLQSPQVRAANGQKASLRIGDKVPIASGGIQPFGGQVGGGFGGLYSQFQFIDVGVNVDITPTVHGVGEVTLKVELEISTVRDRIDVGGISQPVIGQRKVTHEIRIKDGEVSLLGGLMQTQETRALAGIPGLMQIPILKRLFSSESVEKNESELLIALVPHIVRTQGITDVNLKSVAAGTDASVRLSYAPRAPGTAAAPPEAKPPAAAIPGVTPTPAAPEPAPPAAPEKPAEAAKPAPAAAIKVQFRPATVQVQPNGTFTVQLEVENARNLFGAPFHLKFDPQVLRLNEVKAGGLLSGDGNEIIFTRNILNDTGDATVNLFRIPGWGGVHGSGTLAIFTFQAVGKGNTTVTFSQFGLQDSQSQPLQVEVPQLQVNVQ
jgi:general secretion pathway protein D